MSARLLPLALLATLAVAPRPASAQDTTGVRTITLDVADRQITERDYRAETALVVQDDRGLDVRVGVGVEARAIEVRLTNVRGLVRFRASPDRLRSLLSLREPPVSLREPSVSPP